MRTRTLLHLSCCQDKHLDTGNLRPVSETLLLLDFEELTRSGSKVLEQICFHLHFVQVVQIDLGSAMSC